MTPWDRSQQAVDRHESSPFYRYPKGTMTREVATITVYLRRIGRAILGLVPR